MTVSVTRTTTNIAIQETHETVPRTVPTGGRVIIQADARRIPLRDRCVQTVVTSPPYWGLRDYQTARWDGGDDDCDHAVQRDPRIDTSGLSGRKSTTGHQREGFKSECPRCGARRIDLQIGLEPTLEAYVATMVEVFREVRRVLRDDGCVWLNIGDSYIGSWGNYGGQNRGNGTQREIKNGSNAVNPAYDGLESWRPPTAIGTNRLQFFNSRIETGPILYTNAAAIRPSGHRVDISLQNQRTPEGVFQEFFGAQRILIKQGDQDFREVLNFLGMPCSGRISGATSCVSRDGSDLKIVLDSSQRADIIVSQRDPQAEPELAIAVTQLAAVQNETSLAVNKSSEPSRKRAGRSEAIRNSIASDPLCESVPLINPIDEAISFADTLSPHAELDCDLVITKPGEQECALLLGQCRLTFRGISHLHLPSTSGFVRYAQLYADAIGDANEYRPKQLAMIPSMLARALKRDGWIVRQDIIWAKPNPMPESVTDRPTRSHEYIFLLSKSERYFYDADAIREPHAVEPHSPGNKFDPAKIAGPNNRNGHSQWEGDQSRIWAHANGRNKRSVWTVNSEPTPEAHFATFPTKLIEPCILAGSRPSDLVLDPFLGSGTVGKVAERFGRRWVGLELSADYIGIAEKRTAQLGIMFSEARP